MKPKLFRFLPLFLLFRHQLLGAKAGSARRTDLGNWKFFESREEDKASIFSEGIPCQSLTPKWDWWTPELCAFQERGPNFFGGGGGGGQGNRRLKLKTRRPFFLPLGTCFKKNFLFAAKSSLRSALPRKHLLESRRSSARMAPTCPKALAPINLTFSCHSSAEARNKLGPFGNRLDRIVS